MTTSPSIDKLPNPWWVGTVSGMASYIDACAIVSSGIALTIYQNALGLTDAQVGVASMAITLSIAVGALVGGRLGDRFGRKPVFSVTMLVIALGSAVQVLSGSFTPLLVGTILVGVGTGADLPVSLANIAEAATDDNRGKIIGFSNILWIVGIVGAITAGSVVGDWGRLGGQILYGQIGVVAIVVLLLRLPIPESHVWLEAQAHKAAGAQAERSERSEHSEGSQLSALLKAPYAKPFIALIAFYALVNVPANTGGQFTTWINVNIIGMTPAFSSQLGLYMMPLGFVWGAWFMRIVDTRHRMAYFYVGAACYAGAYLIYIIGGFHVWSFIAVSLVNGFGGAFAFEGMMKVWTQESFPTLLRTTAQGTIIAVARVVCGLAAAVTPVLVRLDPVMAYVILFVIAVVGYAFAVWGFHGRRRNEFQAEAPSVKEAA